MKRSTDAERRQLYFKLKLLQVWMDILSILDSVISPKLSLGDPLHVELYCISVRAVPIQFVICEAELCGIVVLECILFYSFFQQLVTNWTLIYAANVANVTFYVAVCWSRSIRAGDAANRWRKLALCREKSWTCWVSSGEDTEQTAVHHGQAITFPPQPT